MHTPICLIYYIYIRFYLRYSLLKVILFLTSFQKHKGTSIFWIDFSDKSEHKLFYVERLLGMSKQQFKDAFDNGLHCRGIKKNEHCAIIAVSWMESSYSNINSMQTNFFWWKLVILFRIVVFHQGRACVFSQKATILYRLKHHKV